MARRKKKSGMERELAYLKESLRSAQTNHSIAWQQMGVFSSGFATGGNPLAPTPLKLDDYSPDAAPDLQGEVIAWRDWKVTAYGDLTSRNTHAVWRPGPMRAICSFGGSEKDHPAPQSECACGFYGLHNHGEGLQAVKRRKPSGIDALSLTLSGNHHNAVVRGLFAAWGKIIVHPIGIRSEWAELLCLVHPEPSSAIKRAGGYYDVPIFPAEAEALAYATEKGYGLVPEAMRPEPDSPADAFEGAYASGGVIGGSWHGPPSWRFTTAEEPDKSEEDDTDA